MLLGFLSILSVFIDDPVGRIDFNLNIVLIFSVFLSVLTDKIPASINNYVIFGTFMIFLGSMVSQFMSIIAAFLANNRLLTRFV